MANSLSYFSAIGILLAYAFYALGPSVHRSLTVLGALRGEVPHTLDVEEIIVIPDTTHCEDVHYYAPGASLFAACEDNANTRFRWFPPLAVFDDPELGKRGRGSIHVISPKTMKSQRLEFENFDGAFVTHGVDVIADPEDDAAVYIYAINHVPHPDLPKARSQVEVFHHVLGSSAIRHVRSVWHPLIRTPNDVLATSPSSFYITNDHLYAGHGIMRLIEDVYQNAKWTDTVLLRVDLATTGDSAAGVEASVALDRMHNNNGLAHGRSSQEILIASATGGELYFGDVSANGSLTVTERVEVDSVADNPSYFADPFAGSGIDLSGFVVPGVSRGIELADTVRNPNATNPIMVWLLRSRPSTLEQVHPWDKRLLFADDGSRIRSASGAVLVAIDPSEAPAASHDKNIRKAWLFVTGFQSQNMIAVKVDL